MRLLIFWDSITEWYWDLEKWGWANMLKLDFWKKENWVEVGISGISWDEIPDILERFDITTKAFIEKYNEKVSFVFAVWINDSVTNIDNTKNSYSTTDFEQNLKTLISKAKKFNPEKIVFIWLTNVIEKLVCPFPLSTTWKCFKNERIKQFDKIIKNVAKENACEYIELFGILEENDLPDWLHPNYIWHKKMFEKVKEYFKT